MLNTVCVLNHVLYYNTYYMISMTYCDIKKLNPKPSLPQLCWAEINPAEWTQHFQKLRWHVPGVDVWEMMGECPPACHRPPEAEFMTPKWNIKQGDLFRAGLSPSRQKQGAIKGAGSLLEVTQQTRCKNRRREDFSVKYPLGFEMFHVLFF